jgi:hypothetical protein
MTARTATREPAACPVNAHATFRCTTRRRRAGVDRNPGSRGMKILLGGSVRSPAYGSAIRDRGLLWENADG